MRFHKRSTRKNPRLSMVLLDWGVRESFHLLHYLKSQTVPRDEFEVILIEYYDHVSEPLRKFESEVDTWLLLEMPGTCYYHKHLMYNAGTVLSKGEIVLFGDSDAMVRPTFVETILNAFERDPWIVYHMDEFRNVRRDYYPFNYPTFEDVLGDGCINHRDGKTKGVLDDIDPMHSRNFGACMCAWRKDVIAIGGADEDLTYLGHICGPYDMTFRLMNFGRRMIWERNEYLYHTWHPGSDGIDNYLGPHDGKNMSTTAFQALCSGRIPPQVENAAIQLLRTESRVSDVQLLNSLIDPNYVTAFDRSRLKGTLKDSGSASSQPMFGSYRGYNIYRKGERFFGAQPHIDPDTIDETGDERVVTGETFEEVRTIIDTFEARLIETFGVCNICEVDKRYAVAPLALGHIDFRIKSHRENPHIVWVSSLGEARKLASLVTAPAAAAQAVPERLVPVIAEPSAELMEVARRVNEIENQLTAMERSVNGIYNSRTWRALTKAGGFFQRFAGSSNNGK